MQAGSARRSNPEKRRELAGLVLSESHYPAGLSQPRHAHEPASFSLVLRGGYDERIGRRHNFNCQPATLVFRPPDETHSVAFADSPVTIFRLDLSARWLDGLREAGADAPGAALFAAGPPLWAAVRLRREFAAADQFSELAAESLMLELLAATTGALALRDEGRRRRDASKRPPRWLERAREMLREEPHEAPSVAQVARAVGVHPVHLAHEFRRFYGTGAGEYARRTRVALACRLLARTRLPLSQVAALSGFYDQSHLTNSFRRATGVTPAQYRAALSAS